MLTAATMTLKPVRQQVAMNQYRGAIFTPATTKSSGAKKRHINSSVYGRTAAKGIALKMIWYMLCAARSAANATGKTNNQRNHVGSLKMSLSTHCCTSTNLHLIIIRISKDKFRGASRAKPKAKNATDSESRSSASAAMTGPNFVF